MKKNHILLFLFIISLVFKAQNPQFQWAGSMGDASIDAGTSITYDAAGHVYSTGYFQGTVDFDPGPGTFTLLSNGVEDVFVTKQDANGNLLWAVSFGGTGTDHAASISIDATNNLYITGFFNNTVDFNPGPGTNSVSSMGLKDIYICKLDAGGNFVWVKTIGGNSNDHGYSIKVDGAGNIYSTGFFMGNVDFNPGAGVNNLTSAGSDDIFISKLDASGNYIWAKRIGGSTDDIGYSIDVDAGNNPCLTGYFFGTVDFDPDAGVTNLVSAGSFEAFVLKLNNDGTFAWAKKIGSSTGDVGYSIAVDKNDNVLTTGYFTGTVDFDPGPGTSNLTSAGGYEIYISKLNNNGNFLWAKRMGSSTNDAGSTIDTDIKGDVYTTGYFTGTVDFDPGPGTFTYSSAGNNDLYINKLDSLGNFVWSKSIGDIQNDYGQCITVDSTGNVYTTGYFHGTADFDPNIGVTNLTSNGVHDIFIHKMSQCIVPFNPSNLTNLSNQNICIGNTGTLSASATGTVNWYSSPSSTTILSSGTTFITPTLALGNYTYYAEASSCTISLSRTAITVTVNPNPTVTAISNSSLICRGQTATLTANGANTYSWSNGGATASIAVTPSITTNYTVIGTSSAGCTGTAAVLLNVEICNDISEIENSFLHQIKVYPNPSNGKLKIENQSLNNESIQLKIINTIGQIVKNQIVNEKLNLLDISDLPQGMYLIQFQQNNSIRTLKLVKE